MRYTVNERDRALLLSDQIGLAEAARELQIPYNTLAGWRTRRKRMQQEARSRQADPEQKDGYIMYLEGQIRILKAENSLLNQTLETIAGAKEQKK